MKKTLLSLLVMLVLGAIYIYLQPEQQEDDSTLREYTPSEELFVYETEADSKDECSSYEEFDSENKVCYFECSNEDECKDIEKSIDEEINGWLEDDEIVHKDFKESGDDIDKTLVAEYTVSQGEQIHLSEGTSGSSDTAIWQHISNISPDTLSDTYIEQFMIFNDPKNDTLAFVDDTDENGKWRISINLAGYTNSTVRERNLTIVHELGHIVTLNTSQVKSKIKESTCVNYYTAEGCSESMSYLHNFVTRFWTKLDIQKARDRKDVYTKDAFVTEYASSEPEEDIAESFAYFIIDNTKSEETVKDKKVSFFYAYPELIRIRDDMRSGVYSDVVRARKLGVR